MPENAGINKVFLLGTVLLAPHPHADGQKEEYVFTMVTKEVINRKDDSFEHIEYHHIRIPVRLMPKTNRLEKGQMVHIEGKIQTSCRIDETKMKHFKTEISLTQLIVINHPAVPKDIVAEQQQQ